MRLIGMLMLFFILMLMTDDYPLWGRSIATTWKMLTRCNPAIVAIGFLLDPQSAEKVLWILVAQCMVAKSFLDLCNFWWSVRVDAEKTTSQFPPEELHLAKYDVDMIGDDANINIDISMLMLSSILALRLMPMCNLFLQNCANHLTEHDCNSEEEVGVPHQLHLKPLFIIIYENKFTIMYKQLNIVYSNAHPPDDRNEWPANQEYLDKSEFWQI